MTRFRRVFLDHGCVCIETGAGEVYYLPNPTLEGKTYDPARLMSAVIDAQAIDLGRWKRME